MKNYDLPCLLAGGVSGGIYVSRQDVHRKDFYKHKIFI